MILIQMTLCALGNCRDGSIQEVNDYDICKPTDFLILTFFGSIKT